MSTYSRPVRARPIDPPGRVADAGALDAGLELEQAPLGGRERGERPSAGRAGPAAGTRPRRRRRARRGRSAGTSRPRRRRAAAWSRTARARRRATRVDEQPRGHVDPLEAAAEHEEPPAVVVAHRRLGEPGEHGRALADVVEEGVRAQAVARRSRCAGNACQVALRHSHISDGDRLAGAAGVLAGGVPRAGDRARVRRRRRRARSRTVAACRATSLGRRRRRGSPSSERQAASSSVHGSSSRRCTYASRMRAVSSARST